MKNTPIQLQRLLIITCIVLAQSSATGQPRIDREALVGRHNITFTTPDQEEIPQVGNGEIAFGIDVTGLQTLYGNTLSQWGWHTSPLPEGKTVEDFRMTEIQVHGHAATYPVTMDDQEEIYMWLRKNPHRLHLGKLSFLIDGHQIDQDHVSAIHQQLNLWRGVIYSNYRLKGIPVTVITTCHPTQDALAVRIQSPLIEEKRLSVQIAFPYGNPDNTSGADWNTPGKHATELSLNARHAQFSRTLDRDAYRVRLGWDKAAKLEEATKHSYILMPLGETDTFSFVCHFTAEANNCTPFGFDQALEAATEHWEEFWQTGGAVDLSGSTDARWQELERRIVLSQYLLAVNEAGSLPPQESGLVLNSGWYGKFHLEMHWWHGAHYQLWNRRQLFDRSLHWYREKLPEAKAIAKRQGYRGARWPKMVGPDGRFGPSTIGPWLIWQQPHPIFYAEQNYRDNPTSQTLEKWKDVVFQTAEFMASYAHKNEETGKYDLGPWLVNAAENNVHTKESTVNPAFELAYWRYGLAAACRWSERLGLPTDKKWSEVLQSLAPLPVEDGLYVMYEGVPDMWDKFNNSHIDVIGTGAFLPASGVDMAVLNSTINKVLDAWKMESTWGWDFPWLAMAAARAGQPQKAVDALLMDSKKNRYSKCGVNKGGPANIYFPGNGGLLYAVAMMAAGWDGAPEEHAPGFPEDGSWNIQYEGLKRAQ